MTEGKCCDLFNKYILIKTEMNTTKKGKTRKNSTDCCTVLCSKSDTSSSDKAQIQGTNRGKRGRKTSKPYTKSYICDTCGNEFSSKCNLAIHFRIHTNEKNYSCLFCGKKFTYSNALNVHYRIHTGERNYECAICERRFAHKCNLTAHIRTHNKPQSFACKQCGQIFRKKSALITHFRSHPQLTELANGSIVDTFGDISAQDTQKVTCSHCNKNFKSKAYLVDHMKIHSGEKRFVCEYCGKRFRMRNHLSIHTTIHTGLKRFSCGDCDKQFAQKSHLRVHARTHTGEKNYKCGQCGKSFNIKSHLNYHIRVHTGEKNFACDVCLRRFTQNSALTSHRKTHFIDLTPKPTLQRCRKHSQLIKTEILECDLCRKKFTDKILLFDNFKTHNTVTVQNVLNDEVIEGLHSEISKADMKLVVQEMQAGINDVLPQNEVRTNTPCIKLENRFDIQDKNAHSRLGDESTEHQIDLNVSIKSEEEEISEYELLSDE